MKFDHSDGGRLYEIVQKVRVLGLVFLLAAAIAWTMIIAEGCADMGSSLVASDPAAIAPQPGQSVSFATHVLPVFQRYGCNSCHGGSGGLTVTTVAQLLKGGDHGPSVVSGKAETSILVRKLSTAPPFGDRMPQGGPYLSDSTIQLIAQWINQGAKNN